MRLLVETATSRPSAPASEGAHVQMQELEGLWHGSEIHGFAKVVKGELRIPYCYGGRDALDSHFYNVHIVGEMLMARFQWFERSTRGYIVLRRESSDTLRGGWYSARDVPAEVEQSFPVGLKLNLPSLKHVTLKIDRKARCPEWASDYFRQVE